MILERIEDGWKGSFTCGKLGYDIELEAENVSEDYVRRCADVIENMSDELYRAVCEAAKRYCLWFIAEEKDAMGDTFEKTEQYHKIKADTPAEELLPLFTFGTLYIGETEDENELFFTLGGGCEWEIEHGIEAAFKDGTLAYLGSYEGVTADGLDYYIDEEGWEWNHALTFEELTAGIIAKISSIADLGKQEGVSEAQIAEAEQTLKLMFPKEYRAILLHFGRIRFHGHTWTGLCSDGEENVTEATQQARKMYEKLPEKLFVLENTGSNGIICANEYGDVFLVQNEAFKKIHGSISEYLEHCLREE